MCSNAHISKHKWYGDYDRSEFARDLRDLTEPSERLLTFVLAMLFLRDLFILLRTKSPATLCSMTVKSFGD